MIAGRIGPATAPLLAGSQFAEDYEAQLRLEQDAVQEGVSRYRLLVAQSIEHGDGAALKPAERMLVHWLEPVKEMIRRCQRECRRGEPGAMRGVYGPVLQLIDEERAAVIVIREMLGRCMGAPSGVLVSALGHAVGTAIIAEINLDIAKSRDEKPENFAALTAAVRKSNPMRVNHWARKNLDDHIWSRRVAVSLGTTLCWMVSEAASTKDYDQEIENAFEYKIRKIDGKTKGFFSLSKGAVKIIDDGHAIRQYLRPAYLPMVIQPLAMGPTTWGGYLKLSTFPIIKATPDQKAALAASDLTNLYRAHNALNSAAWAIDQDILRVAEEYYEQGGGVCGIPLRNNPPRPGPPEGYDRSAPRNKRWARVPVSVKKAYKKAAAEARRVERKLRADRKLFHQKVDVANRMKRFRTIFFNHVSDFRYRSYPRAQPLNHQGDDLCRGMLCAAKSVPLGPTGLKWLQIHAANCWGLNKTTHDDRLEWVRQNRPQILASARDPIGHPWWHEAEKPWQFLAACMAIADPQGKGSRLLGQKDGSCSALQHYSALGRDSKGAKSVNLVPGDRPEDVYKDVTIATTKLVDQDIADDQGQVVRFRSGKETVERRHKELALRVRPMVRRKGCKQPTMTTCYGVTRVGARGQVEADLADLGVSDKQELYATSAYLSGKVLEGIGSVCEAAKKLMDWLRECAGIYAKQGEPFAWTTPITKLPVVQPYRNFRNVQIRTIAQYVTIVVQDSQVPVKVGKHRNGAPPNFVHSLDATHMFMIAIRCAAAGIFFAGVHDAYWTHFGHMDILDRIVRETFFELHSEPILENMHREMSARFPGVEFPPPPPKGDFDLSSVLQSTYGWD